MPNLSSLDHLVLTVTDIATTVSFYEDVLGMVGEEFTPADGTSRWALRFGNQKINLHQIGSEFSPHARAASAGSADLCFLSETSLADWQSHLAGHTVTIEQGPVVRTGATGRLSSIYIRDPDGNLIEISNRA